MHYGTLFEKCMESKMDRRQRKTREAVFRAFSELLEKKSFSRITVGEIIDKSDVGRATFYAHFETKDYLLKAFCDELFCHIFDAHDQENNDHHHIFSCESSESVVLHLLKHLGNNDNNILALLSSANCELFLPYFRSGVENLFESKTDIFIEGKKKNIPDSLWRKFVVTTLVETIRWWIDSDVRESPKELLAYFVKLLEFERL